MTIDFLKRYEGHYLGPKPHVAVLGSCKVGNFVVTIPLLRLLRLKYPQAIIDFWGSELTRDFEEALCGDKKPISWRCSWDIASKEKPFQTLFQASLEREENAGPIDLLINCDGFNPLTQTLSSWLRPEFVAGGCLDDSCRNLLNWGNMPNQKFLGDKDWDSNDFLNRYKDDFNSNYIAELICRMVFLEPSKKDLSNINLPWKDPNFSVPDILIHCTTARAAKLWPYKHWNTFLEFCAKEMLKVGLVGASPKVQRSEYNSENFEEKLLEDFPECLIDLRGRTTLIELAGASRIAKAVISVDAGPMHVSAGVGTPTLAIVGNDKNGDGVSPIRLWLPRTPCLQRTISSYTSHSFNKNHFKNDDLEEAYLCMDAVNPAQVIDWLKKILRS